MGHAVKSASASGKQYYCNVCKRRQERSLCVGCLVLMRRLLDLNPNCGPAVAGNAGRIAVYAERAAARLPLFEGC